MVTAKTVWDKFTNKYTIEKTLRFELKPIGDTSKLIKEKKIIEEDEQREKDFNYVKRIIDKYYKESINKTLKEISIEINHLKKYQKLSNELKKHKTENKREKELNDLNKLIEEMKKNIQNKLRKNKNYSYENFIKDILPEWLEQKIKKEKNESKKQELKEALEKVKRFSKWITYFRNFFNNREYLFTSIASRIIDDNLPKFLINISNFEELKKLKKRGFSYKEVEKNFKKELGGKSLDSFFILERFNEYLTQEGIDRYNLIIGGKTKSDNTRLRGLNELINEFSQKQKDTKIRKLKLMPLFKQILSDRESFSFIPEKFENDKEVIDAINKYYNTISRNVFNRLKKTMSDIYERDLHQIYVKNNNTLNEISNNIFGNWETIKLGLEEFAKHKLNLNTDKKIENWIKKQKYFSIYEIEEGIKKLKLENKVSEHFLCDYFSKLKKDNTDLIENIKTKYNSFKKITPEEQKNKRLFHETREKDVETIKEFLDSIMELLHFIKPLFTGFEKDTDKKTQHMLIEQDTDFYYDFDEIYNELKKIVSLYNKTRNYVTQKPSTTKKFKLNFQNYSLMDGWDKNKVKDNLSVILRKYNPKRKSYDYFLGILTSDNKKIFDKILNNDNKNKDVNHVDLNNKYELMRYRSLPEPHRMLPKIIFSKKNIGFFNPPDEILYIRNHATYSKSGSPQKGYTKKEFKLSDCHKFIDFLKNSLNKYPEWKKEFNFKFKKTKEYSDISEFYKDVSNQGYKVEFINIQQEDIDDPINLIKEKKLYLFQIWNKDFSEHSKGKPNLHTIYWSMLFDERNLKDVVFKLQGKAEMFYRKKSLEKTTVHPANKPIKRKESDGESKFPYKIIKDRRYTEDKFLFHCPIKINFKADSFQNLNELVNSEIKRNSKKIHILGIDRGERNLIYCALLDPKGNIILQKSLNIIDDAGKKDYQKKLDKLETSREEARKNWKKITAIKDLKEGYLSQVIHIISKLVIENNAIIVLEDLNYGFKRGRFKIEKQIYQKFEKMLIEKLNFLMFKDKDAEDIGGPFKAYQLTNKFKSFKELKKQSGIMFYVPASYTSKICPLTGFVNVLPTKYKSIEDSIDFFKKFKIIRYIPEENIFEFNFNYSDFTSRLKLKKDNWSIYTYGDRLIKQKTKNSRKFETKKIYPTDELKKLFRSVNIDFEDGRNLVNDICSVNDSTFFKNLITLLRYTLQLRNSYTQSKMKQFEKKDKDFKKSDYDYILSCVKDKHGRFFDSRKAKENEPRDADANGAYHIALKGLLLIEKIKNSKNGRINMKIDNNEFINFVMQRKN